MIPFLDLKRQYSILKEEILKNVEEVFEKNAFTNGFSVKNFEKSFAEYCNVNHAVAVNSGTSALHLAMRVLDIEEGDEVIIPANTFIASAWAPAYVNAKPVFVDCDKSTWQIDVNQIKEKINSKTKAIIGVHLYGQPCDILSIKEICKEHDLYFIEDAAQAHGALFNNQKVGGIGDIACFSFYPGKNLGTYGEGGIITTNNEEFAQRLERLRNHASSSKYAFDELGYNMRMGGVEAAVLNVKMKHIDNWNERRRDIAQMYFNGISNSKLVYQYQPEHVKSVFHLFVLTCEERTDLINYLNNKEIYPGLHYPIPCHLQKAFDYLEYKKGDFPISEYLAENCVSLPMFPELKDEEVNTVIDALNNY